MLIGAAAFLILLGSLAAAATIRRLNRSLRTVQETLQVAADDRRKLEVTLRNTKESSTFAQASAGIATFDVNVQTDELSCSGNYFEFLSIPQANRASDRAGFLARIHPDDINTVLMPENKITGNSTTYQREYRIVLDNGQVRWISEKGNITRNSSGEATRIIGAMIDLTDLKSAQAALLAAEKVGACRSRHSGRALGIQCSRKVLLVCAKICTDAGIRARQFAHGSRFVSGSRSSGGS